MKLWDVGLFSTLRKAGLIKLITRVQNSDPVGRVSDVLTKVVRPGDVVWDVGAGDGTFSELFCELVGSEGYVFAFEPRGALRERIRERVPNCGWLRVERITLGVFDAPNLLVANGGTESDSHEVCRGDTMCERLGQIPNVLKVAVQGFEEEVLAGMGTKLASLSLREVMIEVNFPVVPRMGGGMAPRRMEGLLGAMGFKTKWVDESHLFATRS